MKTLLQTDITGLETFSGMGIIILILVLIFIVSREFFCWYYKINARIKLQQQMNANIEILIKLQGGTPVNDITKKK